MIDTVTDKQELIRVTHLSKALGDAGARVQILGDIDFTGYSGEFVSIVGPSGCGKTTLLMCLAGLLAPDSGSLFVGNANVVGPPPDVSVVFQEYGRSLLPWRSNVNNVRFGMRRLTGMTRDDEVSFARELLTSVGLTGYEDFYPWQLSGGMQQRVAIARALASKSKLLLLDEPLAAVDAQTRADMQDLLLSLAKTYNRSCILVTHDVDEAVYLADRILVLSARPTRVVREFPVHLAKPRDQLATKENPEFLRLRHDVLSLIQSARSAAPQAHP